MKFIDAKFLKISLLIIVCFACCKLIGADNGFNDEAFANSLCLIAITYQLDSEEIEPHLISKEGHSRYACGKLHAVKIFKWQIIFYKFDHVPPGKYSLRYMTADDSYFGDYYKNISVVVGNSPTILFDTILCIRVKVLYDIALKHKNDDLLFGCMIKAYSVDGDCIGYSNCSFFDDDGDYIDINTAFNKYCLRIFVRDNSRWFFGKEIILDKSRIMNHDDIVLTIDYAENAENAQKMKTKIGRKYIREIDSTMGRVSIAQDGVK